MKRSALILMIALAAITIYGDDVCGQLADLDPKSLVDEINRGRIPIQTSVELKGIVEEYCQPNDANTKCYKLKDDLGKEIDVVTSGALPETYKKYVITGIVARDFYSQKYYLDETSRAEVKVITGDTTKGKDKPFLTELSGWVRTNGLTATLVISILVIGGILVGILSRREGEIKRGITEFPAGAVIQTVDKTSKITAHVPTEKAIREGTVKVMPGRFEVNGGELIKEIRLIRPQGVPDHRIEYSFGRLKGDQITHIQLEDQTVSSKQARLRYKGGKYVFINIPDPDDPDRNASLINKKPMQAEESVVLKDGDEIQMGYVKLTFRES